MMRRCSKCRVEKSLEFFGIHKQRKDGISLWCKQCSRYAQAAIRSTEEGAKKHRDREKARYAENPEPAKLRANLHRLANLEKHREKSRIRSKKHGQKPESKLKRRVQAIERYKNDPGRSVAKVRERQLRLTSAQPSWLSFIQKAQIQEFYEISAAKNAQTGVNHHVDHIFPLKGDGFNGLHVPWNLQVLTATENDEKSTKVPAKFASQLWSNP